MGESAALPEGSGARSLALWALLDAYAIGGKASTPHTAYSLLTASCRRRREKLDRGNRNRRHPRILLRLVSSLRRLLHGRVALRLPAPDALDDGHDEAGNGEGEQD